MKGAREIYEFGAFRLEVKERRLLRDGHPVQLRAKVFDTLRLLVENHGRLVGKDGPANYDEALVGTYTLPNPLVLANGKRVTDAETWFKKRRPEIVKLFESNMHGRSPGRPAEMKFNVFDKSSPAFHRTAIRKQVEVRCSKNEAAQRRWICSCTFRPVAETGAAPALPELLGEFEYRRRSGSEAR